MADSKEDAEDIELDAEIRRHVLELHANLDRITAHELLGVAPDADKKTIKRAYFRLAATMHPDRHFGKKLGSFKQKMEQVFRKISDAHDKLISAEKKVSDDTKAKDAERKAEEAKRALELATREKAKPHIDAAERAKSVGDLPAAIAAYRLARAILPDDKDLESAQQGAQRALAERASEGLVRQALLEEKHGHWAQAATTWKRVIVARPHDQDVRARLANALAKARGT